MASISARAFKDARVQSQNGNVLIISMCATRNDDKIYWLAMRGDNGRFQIQGMKIFAEDSKGNASGSKMLPEKMVAALFHAARREGYA